MKGIYVSGEVKITGKYGPQIQIANKNINGEYEYMYIDIQLPKGQPAETGTTIQIHKGFLSFYKNKDGLCKPKIVVMEYTPIEEPKADDPELELPF